MLTDQEFVHRGLGVVHSRSGALKRDRVVRIRVWVRYFALRRDFCARYAVVFAISFDDTRLATPSCILSIICAAVEQSSAQST